MERYIMGPLGIVVSPNRLARHIMMMAMRTLQYTTRYKNETGTGIPGFFFEKLHRRGSYCY
jgi:hypothetical protein